jgi:hypothetical protein
MEKHLQLFVRGMEGKTSVLNNPDMPVKPSTTILQLRKIIKAKTGIPEDEQVLVYAGKPLLDLDPESGEYRLVSHYNMVDNGTITLGLRVRGGLELIIEF